MDNRDYMKAYGEWLCSIAPSPMVKSLMHGSMSTMYQRDYIIVTNLCDGFFFLPEILMSIIDGAKERYKEFNKAVLEISPLSEVEKKEVSAQIDLNAEEQKRKWINILQAKGITITE
ncbi:MAG: hypothetical protein K2K81_03270 [Muribaculaceae bacterium]|nr:hypothetical protein [Muribaculaceae bacterium]